MAKEGYEPHALEHHNGAPGTNEHGHTSTRAYAHYTPKYVPTPTHFPPTPTHPSPSSATPSTRTNGVT
jgi:hypothetical protein